MSEKSPAVLQTNRNIWNFFQLCRDRDWLLSLLPQPERFALMIIIWCCFRQYKMPHNLWAQSKYFSILFHDYFHTVHFSIWNILWFLVFFFLMWKAFWKLNITYIHYEMKIPHVFRMEKKILSFQESFVSLLKTRVLTMRVILPNKFPPCFSGL